MRSIIEQLALLVRADPGGMRPHERESALTRDNASEIRAVVMLNFPVVVALIWPAVEPGLRDVFLTGVAAILAFNVAGWTVPWRRLPRWAETVPPVGSLVALWVMAATAGGLADGYGVLVLVPLVWIAMYGDPPDLVAGLAVTAACALAPLETWFPSLPDQGPILQRAAILAIVLTSVVSVRPIVVQLREQVRTSRRATYALRASQAALAHDLRTPLTSVCALASLAEQRLDEGDAIAAKEYVQRISALGWRAEETIRGVLDLSRAGELLPSATQVDVRALIDDVAGEVDGVALSLGDLPGHVVGHEPSLRRLFANLLQNAALHARDATPGAVANVAIDATSTATGWKFTVVDDGPGIDRAEQELVFEPWRRGADARDGGHGLGLAIVAAIVEQHGGTIGVDHDRPSGAHFVFTLARTPHVGPADDELVARSATGVPLA